MRFFTKFLLRSFYRIFIFDTYYHWNMQIYKMAWIELLIRTCIHTLWLLLVLLHLEWVVTTLMHGIALYGILEVRNKLKDVNKWLTKTRCRNMPGCLWGLTYMTCPWGDSYIKGIVMLFGNLWEDPLNHVNMAYFSFLPHLIYSDVDVVVQFFYWF